MKTIEPQPAEGNADIALNWLSEKENHMLDDSGLSGIVRILICRVNQLSTEVDYLRNRINQHDSFI